MKEYIIQKYNILNKLFILFSITILATGNFFDDRLSLFDIDFSVVFSFIYLILLCINLTLLKKIKLSSLNILQYTVFSYMIVSTLILWIIFDIHEYNDLRYGSYAVTKYFTILLFIIPYSFLINHHFNNSDINFLVVLLFSISCILFIISIFYVNIFLSGRSGVLGGGPIILSRWLCFGAICLLFLPYKIKFRVLFSLLFLGMAMMTGSRGPIVSIILVILIYFMLNFKKLFRRFMIILSIFIALVMTSIQFLENIRPIVRIFSNLTYKSLEDNPRILLFKDSINMILEYPFGVGCGNFSAYSNTKLFFTKMKAYPHNLFLEVFNEYGIMCGLLFLFFIIISLYKGYKSILINKSRYSELFFYLSIYLLVNSMFSGDFIDARILLLFIPIMTKDY